MAEALKSNCKQKHGAVIVKGGSVISTGFNKMRNDPAQIPVKDLPLGVSVHAEIDALKKCKDPKGADIYIVRINSVGHMLLSKPCFNCWQILVSSGIKGMHYT